MIKGTIVDVSGGGTIWLLLVSTERRIITQPVDHRCMTHIAAGLGVSHPTELVGRDVRLSDDGSHIAFP